MEDEVAAGAIREALDKLGGTRPLVAPSLQEKAEQALARPGEQDEPLGREIVGSRREGVVDRTLSAVSKLGGASFFGSLAVGKMVGIGAAVPAVSPVLVTALSGLALGGAAVGLGALASRLVVPAVVGWLGGRMADEEAARREGAAARKSQAHSAARATADAATSELARRILETEPDANVLVIRRARKGGGHDAAVAELHSRQGVRDMGEVHSRHNTRSRPESFEAGRKRILEAVSAASGGRPVWTVELPWEAPNRTAERGFAKIVLDGAEVRGPFDPASVACALKATRHVDGKVEPLPGLPEHLAVLPFARPEDAVQAMRWNQDERAWECHTWQNGERPALIEARREALEQGEAKWEGALTARVTREGVLREEASWVPAPG